MIELKDGSTTTDPRLDRLVQFDERSRSFPIRPEVEDKPLRSYSWNKNVWLDQGSEGACVGFSVCHELAARPGVVTELTNWYAREEIYWEAQKRDPWAGGAYPGAEPFYEGSSVLAGIQVAHELGYFEEYRWAFSEHDLALAVGYRGPAVLGVNWYTGMFDTDADGYISPTGQIAGGHAILCAAISVKNDAYRLDNSWGLGWGVNGSCYIKRADLARLLAEDGEACIPVDREGGPAHNE